jgi:hypothetical protein
MAEKVQRPEIGQRVRITGEMEREKRYIDGRWSRQSVTWRECGSDATGVYIGYRTVAEGEVRYIDSETGSAFFPKTHFEVWLIVTDPRQNPIKCRPEQVVVEAQS